MKKKIATSLSLLSLAALTLNLSVQACSFDSQPYFTYTVHPDLPLQKYADGELGILQPTYARSYLITAYRYLSGAPLSADEQKSVLDLWQTRLTATDFSCAADTTDWLKARAAVPGAPKLESIWTERAISKDEPYQTYCNCQTPAFATATKTLGALIQKYGATSPSVKDWLKAQDAVFSNCGSPPFSDKPPAPASFPVALPATADPALQQDRAYQIAAANFYAQNFAAAQKDFESIASDTTSPWKQVAVYLAVRCMIRQATLAKETDNALLIKADAKLKELAAEPAYATMAGDIAELRSFISARATPEQHLEEISREKLTAGTLAELTKTIDQLVSVGGGDQTTNDYDKLPATVKKPDMIDWVMTFQAPDAAAKKHAVLRWKETHSLPWLVAAASAIEKSDPDYNAVVTAASESEKGPAKWTLTYLTQVLNLNNGKDKEARTALDQIVDHPAADLPTGSLNQFKVQRLTVAQNLDEFVRFGVQVPLSICTNGGVEQVPDDVEQILKTGKGDKATAEFIPQAASVMDIKMPLAVLKQLAVNTRIPNDLRNNVAWTSWVRSILVGEDAAARELAQIAKPLNKAKTKLFDAYLAEPTPEGRKFAATMLMLQFSSAEPNVAWGPLRDDDYGDSSGCWWSASPSVGSIQVGYDNSKAVEPFNPLFLTAAQQAQAKAELARLAKVEAAPNYFAKIVLPYAKAHPADPRVPQALHLLVKATRYGNTDDATKVFSKEAFTILHTRYKGNTWTKETPYYY